MQTATGRKLIETWLHDPDSRSTFRQLLHGLAVAVHHYAHTREIYQELRKKQPDHFVVGDFEAEVGREMMKRSGRRLRGPAKSEDDD